MSNQDYYSILGLAKTATEDEIKQAYRRLAMKFHPDRSTEVGAEEKFKSIKEAYESLSDPDKKHSYDRHGHDNNRTRGYTHTNANFTESAAFKEMFSDYFNRSNDGFDEGSFSFKHKPQQTDVIVISLADAYIGKTLQVTQTTTIVIPKGLRSGTKLYADGKLYKIDVQQHYKFKRAEDDLLVDIEINAIEAMLGTEAILNNLDDKKLQFTIPAGIQPGQIVRLSGRGMKNPEFDKHGDILVRVGVSIPKILTEEQKTILKTMRYRSTIDI